MAKTKPTKLICPACMGNGYRKIFKDASSNLRVVIDCEACDNQGEIENDEKNIFAMRYLNYMLLLHGVCTSCKWIKYCHKSKCLCQSL